MTSAGPMSSGPGFVTSGMNLPLNRVNVISPFAEDLVLPLTLEDETAAVFVDACPVSRSGLAADERNLSTVKSLTI
jgi:hypothetical protein